MHVTPSATLVKGGEIAYVGGTVIDTYTFEGAASCRFGDASIIDEEKMAVVKKDIPVIIKKGGKFFKGGTATVDCTFQQKKGKTPAHDAPADRPQAWRDADALFKTGATPA